MDDDAYLLKKEKQRRQKISSANKGKTPWNKGRQHSEGIDIAPNFLAISNQLLFSVGHHNTYRPRFYAIL